MKSLLIIYSVVFLLFNTCLQTTTIDAPAEIKTAFAQKFPDAKNVKWDRENEKEWEAEFKMNGKAYSANFDNHGAWLETEAEIHKKDLPENVLSTLKSEYNEYSIEETGFIETPDIKGYEILLEAEEANIELVIDDTGTILKKEVKNEGDGKD